MCFIFYYFTPNKIINYLNFNLQVFLLGRAETTDTLFFTCEMAICCACVRRSVT